MQLSTSEAIHQIQEVYHQQYAPDSFFDALDQLLICKTLAESSPVLSTYNPKYGESNAKDNTSVNGSVNDSYKPEINATLFENKQSVFAQLIKCTFTTPPVEIAALLRSIFWQYPTIPSHWLYVAQHWNPRAINRVLRKMNSVDSSGRTTINNPPAFFTFLIKKRKQRRRP